MKLVIGLLALNVLNLPLMIAGQGGAAPMAGNPALLPTVILFTILLAFAVTWPLARTGPRRAAEQESIGAPGSATS